MAKELTDAEFDGFIKDNKMVIVDFWADWCGPCRMVEPVFEELSKEFEGKIEFAKIDTMANPEIPKRFGVMSLPTFIIFKDGEQIGEFYGAMMKDDFKSKLGEFL